MVIIGFPIYFDSKAGTHSTIHGLKAPNGVHLHRKSLYFSSQGKTTFATCYSIHFQVNNYDSSRDEGNSKFLIKQFQCLNTQVAVFILSLTFSFILILLISLCYGFLWLHCKQSESTKYCQEDAMWRINETEGTAEDTFNPTGKKTFSFCKFFLDISYTSKNKWHIRFI